LIKEFQLYHYKVDAAGMITDDPDTEHDHWIDALRYAVTNLFGKGAVILSSAGLDVDMTKLVDSTGSFFKPPTPEEYAKVNNIPFNPEVNLDKMGKIGRLSEIEDDEDQGADGGFIWQF